MKKLFLLALFLLFAATEVYSQPVSPPITTRGLTLRGLLLVDSSSGGVIVIRPIAIASLPAAPDFGAMAFVSDGADAADCSTGEGAFFNLCKFDGADWIAIGGGHSLLAGLSGDAHPDLVFFEAAAGAASCNRNGQIQFVVADLKIYPCFVADGNPVDIGDMIVNFIQVCTDGTCTTANLPDDVLTLAGGVGLTSSRSGDTVTFDIDNHVKTQMLQLATDGTQCADPAYASIGTLGRRATIKCADNNGSTIYASGKLPDSWAGDTITFFIEYIQTAADTGPLHADVSAVCRGPGEENAYGSEAAIDDAGVTGSEAIDRSSAAVTPGGTCAAGDTIEFQYQLDATGTTTDVTTLHFMRAWVEYTVTGAGSD